MSLVTISQYFIILVSVVVCVMCVWGLLGPDKLIGLVRGVMDHAWGMVLAVGVRLLLGMALLLAASQALFPVVFGYLGWIAITAAAVLPFIGRERIGRLIDWFAKKSGALMRVWLLFGFLFGGFLIYATDL